MKIKEYLNGFTLTELLTMIFIVAVLVSFILTALKGY
jgi:prepilin-type N-terminal cleavage/methylation domain-containing protein